MLAQLGDAWSDIYLEDGLGVNAEDPAFNDAVLRDNGASVFKEALKKSLWRQTMHMVFCHCEGDLSIYFDTVYTYLLN